MIGVFIYAAIAAAAIFLLVGAKKKNRLGMTMGVLFFAFALGALAVVQVRARTYWLAMLYGVAAVSQVYAALRTWRRWPSKTPDQHS
jgi:uncharacterized membrane protein